MRASDLRINNLVSVKKSELKSFLDDYGLQGIENSFEVVSIDNVHLNILIDGLECEYYLSDCEPIPLKEEWLLKFGFRITKDPEHNFYEKPFDIYHIQLKRLIGKNVFYLELNKPNGVSYLIKQIQHVHQLQNLYFALTGEELKIN